MYTGKYLPEGCLTGTARNSASLASAEALRRAAAEGQVLEAPVIMCDAAKNLIVDLNGITGVIPRAEAALGSSTGAIREIAIIGRVGKPTCFVVESVGTDDVGKPVALLSRRRAQMLAQAEMMRLEPGDVIPAKVTHLEPFGAFVDAGCGVISLIGIEHISVSRIPHPSERFSVGDDVLACVSSVDRALGRIALTHRELLGTWLENAERFAVGETVSGIVRSIEPYGVFIELAPNLSGLAEQRAGLEEGQRVSVYIKSIIPERMKIKLVVIDVLAPAVSPDRREYYINSGHIDRWRYSPPACAKKIVETVFK